MPNFTEELGFYKDLLPERTSIWGLFRRPLFYLRIRKNLKLIENKIKKIDFQYKLPKLKIRYTFKNQVDASCTSLKNGGILLKVNPNPDLSNFYLLRILTHELMHIWIGFDMDTGKVRNMPADNPLIKKVLKFYINGNYSLRYKLCCFLCQQALINKIDINKMMHREGYDDPFFKNRRNPYIDFEEMLVVYATMKLWADPIDCYPPLKKAFDEDYDDKKLLLFIDKEMPDIRSAVEKLISQF